MNPWMIPILLSVLLFTSQTSFAKTKCQQTFKRIDCFNSQGGNLKWTHEQHIKKIAESIGVSKSKLESIIITGYAPPWGKLSDTQRMKTAQTRAVNVENSLKKKLAKLGVDPSTLTFRKKFDP